MIFDLSKIDENQRASAIASLVETEGAHAGVGALQTLADTQGDKAVAQFIKNLRPVDVAAMVTTGDISKGSLVAEAIEAEEIPPMLLELIRLRSHDELSVFASIIHQGDARRKRRAIEVIMDTQWGESFFVYILIEHYGNHKYRSDYSLEETPEDEWVIVLSACLENKRFVKEILPVLETRLIHSSGRVGNRDYWEGQRARAYAQVRAFLQESQQETDEDDLFQPL